MFSLYSTDYGIYGIDSLVLRDIFHYCVFSKSVEEFSSSLDHCVNVDCSNYYKCQLYLYDDLLKQSRPSLRPIEDGSKNTSVRLGFSLIRLVSIVC